METRKLEKLLNYSKDKELASFNELQDVATGISKLHETLGSLSGLVGPAGPQGEKGDKGDAGERGQKGDKGDTGEKGDVGPVGMNGRDGKPGKDGLDGKDGESIIGPAGINGKDGKDAIYTDNQIVEKIIRADKLIPKEKVEGLLDLERIAKLNAENHQYRGSVGSGAIRTSGGATWGTI